MENGLGFTISEPFLACLTSILYDKFVKPSILDSNYHFEKIENLFCSNI